MIHVHDLLAQGTVVGMLGDRSLRNDDTRQVDFFGEPAALPLGPFRMAAIMKRPVLFMTGLYRGGNRYDIHFETLADFSAVPPRGRTLAVAGGDDALCCAARTTLPHGAVQLVQFLRLLARRASRQAGPVGEHP